MTAQHDLVRKALKLWRAVDADSIGRAEDVARSIKELETTLAGFSKDIADLKKTALRKTANGHVLKPSDRGIEFLFKHDFIHMESPPIEPYHVVASRMAFHQEETDVARRWRPMLAGDGRTALLDRYQVFGFQIKPDESDPQAVRNNPDCYRCYLHALLDERHSGAGADDGAHFDPDALQEYSQVKWKRGDEHTRGKMWEDRQRLAAGEAGEQQVGDLQVYRLFTGTRSLQEYVPRYLRMEEGQPARLALVDLREEALRPARAAG